MTVDASRQTATPTEKQLESATWGVFFVWIGIALLAHLGWGVWLLGVGAITLGAQLARKLVGLHAEVFWIVAGALFVLGGVAEIIPFEVDVALIPIVCIVGGVGLLVRAIVQRSTARHA